MWVKDLQPRHASTDTEQGYEGYNYSPKNETTIAMETADLQTIFPYAKQSFFSRLYELYPAEAFNATLWQRQQIYGDYIIDCRKTSHVPGCH